MSERCYIKGRYSLFLSVILVLAWSVLAGTAFSYVVREGKKVYLVDQTGERWDVTQAESIGFRPEGFQYGIGRHAFTTLGDANLNAEMYSVPRGLRVIGVEEGGEAQAYSVRKLTRHEIANTTLGSSPIVVGY